MTVTNYYNATAACSSSLDYIALHLQWRILNVLLSINSDIHYNNNIPVERYSKFCFHSSRFESQQQQVREENFPCIERIWHYPNRLSFHFTV